MNHGGDRHHHGGESEGGHHHMGHHEQEEIAADHGHEHMPHVFPIGMTHVGHHGKSNQA